MERQLQAAENSRDTAARAALLPEVRKAAEKAEVQAVLAREARAAKRRVLVESDERPAGLDEAGEIHDVPWVPTGRRKA